MCDKSKKTCFGELKIEVITSVLKDLENFHGEGYFEIGLEVWVSVQQEWVGVAKAQKKHRFWKTKSISANKK